MTALARRFGLQRICRSPDDPAAGGGAADGTGGAKGGDGAGGAGGGGNPGGAAGTEWSTGLDDGAKALVKTRGWEGKPIGEVMPAMLKSYGELEGLVGTSVKIPGKDAKPEDWAAFNKKLGVPEKADAYVIPKREGGDYTPRDLEFQKGILPAVHAAGLSQRQLDILAPAWNAYAANLQQNFDKAAETLKQTGPAELQKEWPGEKFNQNLELANAAVRQVFGDKLGEWQQMRLADGTFLGDNPMVARAFAKLGASLKEEGVLVTGDSAGGGDGGANAGAQRELDAIYAAARVDKDHPYTNPKHPEHGAMLDKVMKLTQQVAGNE